MHQNEAANLSKVKVSTTFPSSSIRLLEAQNEKLLTEALLKAPKTSGFKIAWKSANIVRTKGIAAYLPKLFPSPAGKKNLVITKT